MLNISVILIYCRNVKITKFIFPFVDLLAPPLLYHLPIFRNVDCESIAVDWINQLIYFTSVSNAIEVVDYAGKNRRAIIWTGLGKPRAIDLDPESGLLFYTDWGDNAHLGRANMDGTDRRILINNTSTLQQIKWPNAMTIGM